MKVCARCGSKKSVWHKEYYNSNGSYIRTFLCKVCRHELGLIKISVSSMSGLGVFIDESENRNRAEQQ
jgi:hypothetical protein